jgi:hypothetical protein
MTAPIVIRAAGNVFGVIVRVHGQRRACGRDRASRRLA